MFNVGGGFTWVVGVSLVGYFLGSAIPNIVPLVLPIVLAIIVVSVAPTSIHLWKENRMEHSTVVRKRLDQWAPPQ